MAVLAMSSPALATTYEVTRTDDPAPGGCNPNDCSLREAISAANARFGADTVLLRGGRTYLEQLAGAEDANASGDFDINDETTIRPTGRGLATVDGNGLDRVFEVITPGSDRVTLSHLAITGGVAPGATGQGGGVLNQAGRLRVIESRVMRNAAPQGGGGGIASVPAIGGGEASLSLTKSVVTRNSATFAGGINVALAGAPTTPYAIARATISKNTSDMEAGGAYLSGPGTLSHVKVLENQSGGAGGGLFVNSNGANSFDHLTVADNDAAADGGGIKIRSSSPPLDVPRALISTSTIAGNSAGGAAGAGGGIDNNRRLRISRSTLSGNVAAGGGGGIANHAVSNGGPAELELANVTIADNDAFGFGGGVDNYESGELRLNNVTVAYNAADIDGFGGGSGGGLQNAYEQGARATIGNTLVVGNAVGASGIGATCAGTFDRLGGNLLADLAGCSGFSESDRLAAPPKIGPLAANGGSTKTVALREASPAINRGGPDCEPKDQRGVKRRNCDTGAYERE